MIPTVLDKQMPLSPHNHVWWSSDQSQSIVRTVKLWHHFRRSRVSGQTWIQKMIWNGYGNTAVPGNLVVKKMKYVIERIMNLCEIPAKESLLNSAQGTICTALSLRSERDFLCFPIKRLGASVARTACKTWEQRCSRVWFPLRGQTFSRERLNRPGVEYLHHYPRAGAKWRL